MRQKQKYTRASLCLCLDASNIALGKGGVGGRVRLSVQEM